jgi:outer membrane protein TolC
MAPSAGARPTIPDAADTAPGLSLGDVVRATLAHSPEIAQAELDVEAQRGALGQARGAYDPAFGAAASTLRSPVPSVSEQGVPSISRATAMEYRVGVDQRLRSGVVLSPSLLVRRTDAGGTAFPYSQAEAAAQLTVPLLRGRGETTERAGERAAGSALAAGQADLRHRRSRSVLDAVLAYWSYAAADRRLGVLREAQGRAATLLGETEALIRADVRPAIDTVPLRAALASKRADVIAGEAALLAARHEVAVAMGISPEAFLALAPPSTPFPSGDAAALPPDSALVADALRRRADLAGAERRREAAHQLLAGARAERRPQLDLRMTAGVAGVEGSRTLGPLLTPLYGDRNGFHLAVDVAYGIPVRNHAAEGAALQRSAAERQSALRVAELARTVALDVLTASATLRSALAGLEQARQAARLHALAVEAEKSKFRLGTSTLFDVLFAEDALTGATLAELAARERVAGALARLRFESGRMAGDGGDGTDEAAALAGPSAPPGR